MKPPAICMKRPTAGRHGERGVTMVLVALAMVAIIAMAALSIDVVTLYLANAEAQRSADAAALAAARVLSMTGMTGDPNNGSAQWANICGGPNSPASQVAKAVATQNTVSGTSPSPVTVMYAAGGASNTDCSALGGAFGVNPTVTVKVQRTGLPTFFSRMWSRTPSSVSASATAEAFNPSNSGNVGNNGGSGTVIPIRTRCVKPWIVPNLDPGNPASCSGTCQPFVGNADGSIQNPGVRFGGTGSGVIGERFTIVPDCRPSGPCATPGNTISPPSANVVGTVPPPNLQFVPGQVSSSSVAVPSCGDESDYMQAIAGCDQSTVYQCGVPQGNTVDLSQNNILPDTAIGGQCLINEVALTGQDVLDDTVFPYRIKAGANSPLKNAGVAQDTFITSSNSIASIPIFDQNGTFNTSGTTDVTIVGFLQVFINGVDPNGNIDVTVLNVAGCGNGTPPAGNPVSGSSPVLVRLIQKYP
jgi:Flp pilus assembly protein TadG